MSGRLTISGKKSYCPWKRENVERVLRDERRAAETAEAALGKKKKQQQPWKKLLLSSNQKDDKSHSQEQPQHVNLFQEEEERIAAAVMPRLAEKSKKRKATAGVMPVFLDQRKSGAELPFYLQTSATQKTGAEKKFGNDASIGKDEKRKDQMDPMHSYHRFDSVPRNHDNNASSASIRDSEEKKSHRPAKRGKKVNTTKHREHHRKTVTTMSKKDDAVWQELRKRRLDRETYEQQRQQDECRMRNERGTSTSAIAKRRKVYNNQFNL